LSISAAIPKRGEVWLVNFDPTIGTEIKKKRPAVIISSDAVGILPIKLCPCNRLERALHEQYVACEGFAGQHKWVVKRLCH